LSRRQILAIYRTGFRHFAGNGFAQRGCVLEALHPQLMFLAQDGEVRRERRVTWVSPGSFMRSSAVREAMGREALPPNDGGAKPKRKSTAVAQYSSALTDR